MSTEDLRHHALRDKAATDAARLGYAEAPPYHLANYPAQCPITGRDFFMVIRTEEGQWVPTYGGPFDSYTIPEWSPDDFEFRSERYDHDADCWVEGGEPYPFVLVDESTLNELPDKWRKRLVKS